MQGRSSGCRLYRNANLKPGSVLIPPGNSLGVRQGDRIRVVANDWQRRATAAMNPAPAIEFQNRDDIQMAEWNGQDGASAGYERIGWGELQWSILSGSRSAWLSLALTTVAIGSAYLSAALNNHGNLDFHLTAAKWTLLGIGATTMLAGWLKDTWL